MKIQSAQLLLLLFSCASTLAQSQQYSMVLKMSSLKHKTLSPNTPLLISVAISDLARGAYDVALYKARTYGKPIPKFTSKPHQLFTTTNWINHVAFEVYNEKNELEASIISPTILDPPRIFSSEDNPQKNTGIFTLVAFEPPPEGFPEGAKVIKGKIEDEGLKIYSKWDAKIEIKPSPPGENTYDYLYKFKYLKQLERLDEAIRLAEETYQRFPEHPFVKNHLIFAYRDTEQYQKAIDLINTFSSPGPNYRAAQKLMQEKLKEQNKSASSGKPKIDREKIFHRQAEAGNAPVNDENKSISFSDVKDESLKNVSVENTKKDFPLIWVVALLLVAGGGVYWLKRKK